MKIVAGLSLIMSISIASVASMPVSPVFKPSSFKPLSSKSSSISSSNTSISPSSYIFDFSNELYPPFDVSDSIYVKGSYTYKSSYPVIGCSSGFKLYSSAYSSTEAYKTSIGSSFLMLQGYSNSYSYQITNVKAYLKYGIKCEIGIWSTVYNQFLNPTHITLNAKSYAKIDPSLYKTNRYFATNSCRGNGQIVNESFLFDDFRNYIDADIYNTLSLGDFSFEYSYPLPLTYKNAYLDIEDTHNLFPLIPISSEGYRRIPIQLVQNAERIYFSFPSTMYVNPETLEMSLTKLSETVETRNFYMPKNKKSLLQSLNMILRVDGIGANEISFDYPIEFNSGNNFLGDCNDSDYCVIGGIRK